MYRKPWVGWIAFLVLTAFLTGCDRTLVADSGAANPSPTPDRLAQPTLPVEPSQADYGAQVYWLWCLPCHGDRGQGLTDEFRSAYPPEDRNCWASGCHGERPYDDGFVLPKTVPPVIGAGTLSGFTTAAQLHAFIQAAMPYWQPGILSNEEGWQVTAFLLRENGLWSGSGEIGPDNAAALKLSAARRGAETYMGEYALPAVLVLLLVGWMFYLFVLRPRVVDRK